MKHIAVWAIAAQFLAVVAGPVLAGPALPEGASESDAKALLSYAPAGNPGGTDFDVADRAAIENLIYAYSFAYDNGAADAWFSLFTDDVVFVAGVPGEGLFPSPARDSAISGGSG